MRDQQAGRLFRLLRVRKAWRQTDAAVRARVSRKIAQKIEGGQFDATSLEFIRRYATAFDLRVELMITGRGGDLARTIDEEHALIVEQLARLLVAHGWIVEPEASFNHYGDRGRIDLLAHHAPTQTMLIIEVKTILTDLQDTFGSINVKERVASVVAGERGWNVGHVASLLAIADSSVSRQVVGQHATLFGAFRSGRRVVERWIEQPVATLDRMLLWVSPPHPKASWNAGRQRVRPTPVGVRRKILPRRLHSPVAAVAPPKRVRIPEEGPGLADTGHVRSQYANPEGHEAMTPR